MSKNQVNSEIRAVGLKKKKQSKGEKRDQRAVRQNQNETGEEEERGRRRKSAVPSSSGGSFRIVEKSSQVMREGSEPSKRMPVSPHPIVNETKECYKAGSKISSKEEGVSMGKIQL